MLGANCVKRTEMLVTYCLYVPRNFEPFSLLSPQPATHCGSDRRYRQNGPISSRKGAVVLNRKRWLGLIVQGLGEIGAQVARVLNANG
jgi:hypothetical protein